MTTQPTLRILGTRGIPAAHGGFETFAEKLALHLVDRGWRVVVYCQEQGTGPAFADVWHGVQRVHVPVNGDGAASTIVFDWKTVVHAGRHRDLCLTLGYNTAVFCAWLRLRGVPNVINMDGIEWSRAKWGAVAKTWFWANDWAGCWLGDHLVADHPAIARHLATRTRAGKITTIAYGADRVVGSDVALLRPLGVEPDRYMTVIARAEPENSLLEIVGAFSRRPRGLQLVVLGSYRDDNPYHRAVKAVASAEVRFPGAIYDKAVVRALRAHCTAYVHGHQVGGTNPSLVEALGAGNAVIAHDNRFNRWVINGDCAEAGVFFNGQDGLAADFDRLLGPAGAGELERMRVASLARFEDAFTWRAILGAYEMLLRRHLPR